MKLVTVVVLSLLALTALLTNNAPAQTIPPQGRLTLTSGTPVMTGDVVATGTVYYAPYQGAYVPIFTQGSPGSWKSYNFSQLTLTLDSTYQTIGNVYDVYVFLNSGTVTIGVTTTSWSSSTSRSVPVVQTGAGIWVNGEVQDLNNGSTIYNPAVYTATYLGSVYITVNGETTVNFKPAAAPGGTNNVIGIWNAYNRVRMSSLCSDSNTDWTYSTAAFEPLDGANGNTKNRVTYLDGLGQSFVEGRVTTVAYNAVQGDGALIGVARDSTNGAGVIASTQSTTAGTAVGAHSFAAVENFPPALGLHYLQATQDANNGTTVTFAFNGGETNLLFEGEY